MKKVVLVTGGGRGIGKAIALKFGEQGYDVVITYNSSKKEAQEVVNSLKSSGSNAHLIKADFTDTTEIEQLFLEFDKHFKSLDVLVNNAGWTEYIQHGNLDELNEEIFNKVIDTDLKAVFFCIKHAVKRMKNKDSSIINISSIAGFNGIGSNIAYCAAKAGVICMTKSFARVLGPNIRVNSVAPGLTDTEMTKSCPQVYREQQVKITPLNRIASPEDIADAVLPLVEKMRFVNGETIIVDGGRINATKSF